MGKFKEFVEAENKKRGTFDPQERINSYRQRVGEFYQKIDEDWLREFIADRSIETGTEEMNIQEEQLGTYSIPEKWIRIGDHTIYFRPIGTILIGTEARIDLVYRSTRVMFVLVSEKIKNGIELIRCEVANAKKPRTRKTGELVWKCADSRAGLAYHKVNAQFFQTLIMKVIHEENPFVPAV